MMWPDHSWTMMTFEYLAMSPRFLPFAQRERKGLALSQLLKEVTYQALPQLLKEVTYHKRNDPLGQDLREK